LYCNNTDSKEREEVDRHKRSTYGQIETEEGFVITGKEWTFYKRTYGGVKRGEGLVVCRKEWTHTREVLIGRHRRQEKASLENQLL